MTYRMILEPNSNFPCVDTLPRSRIVDENGHVGAILKGPMDRGLPELDTSS